MKDSKNILKIKEKLYDGQNLDTEEIKELMDYIAELESLLDEGLSKKQAESGEGFVKYG
jgi:anthranilate phosphoribosyltransferase